MPLVLPYVALSWDAVTPGEGQEFRDYVLERLNPLTEEWEVIAYIDAVDLTEYDDFLAFPGAQSYRVKWRAWVGLAAMESEPVPAAATLTIPLPGSWIHEVQDPDQQARVLVQTYGIETMLPVTPRMARGTSRAPVLDFGQRFSAEYDIAPVPEAIRDRSTWRALLAMARRQRTHAAVFCLRIPATGDRVFVGLTTPQEQLATNLSRGSLRAVEVDFDEPAWAGGGA